MIHTVMERRGRAIKFQFNKGTGGMSTPRRSFISAVLESRACDRAASGMVCVCTRTYIYVCTVAFRSRGRRINQCATQSDCECWYSMLNNRRIVSSLPKKSFDRRSWLSALASSAIRLFDDVEKVISTRHRASRSEVNNVSKTGICAILH